MEVYKHRGRILKQRAGTSFQPLWEDKRKDGKWSFVVNRNNELILRVREMAHENPDKAIGTLLRIIEEAIPTKAVYANQVEMESSQKDAFEGFDMDALKSLAETLYETKINAGLSPDQARNEIKNIEPFNNFEELIDSL